MTRWEIARDRDDGTVALSFMGRTIVPAGARLLLKGRDAIVTCAQVELVFSGLTDENLDWLAGAPAIYVIRTFADQDEMVQVAWEKRS